MQLSSEMPLFTCLFSNFFIFHLFSPSKLRWCKRKTKIEPYLTWEAWWPPKVFLTTVPKRLGEESWNSVTFNINPCSIKKSYFWFRRLSGVTMTTSLPGSTQEFLKLSFYMLSYNEILKVFKSKIWVDIWKKQPKIPLKTKFQRSQSGGLRVTSIWNLGLHCRLKYGLWRHNNVIIVTSQIFCYHCVEYIKLDTCP